MSNQLFMKKPLSMLADELKSEHKLHRILGPVQLSSLGVGAIIGTGIFVLTGVFAQKALHGIADGALFGNPAQLGIQFTAVAAAVVYSGGVSFILLKIIGAVMPLRAGQEDESVGLDLSQHGEEAYVQAGGSESSAF